MTRFYKIATDDESARKPVDLLMSQAILFMKSVIFGKQNDSQLA